MFEVTEVLGGEKIAVFLVALVELGDHQINLIYTISFFQLDRWQINRKKGRRHVKYGYHLEWVTSFGEGS